MTGAAAAPGRNVVTMRLLTPLAIGYILLTGEAMLVNATPTNTSPLICADPGSRTASPADTSIHANSCTDFSYKYPNTPQPANGTNNWVYGYYAGPPDPQSFIRMTQQVTDSSGHFAGWWAADFTRYWTSLDAFGGHPNGDFTDYHKPPYCDAVLFHNCSSEGGLDPRSPDSPDSGTQEAVRRYIVPVAIESAKVDINILAQKDPRTADASAHGTIEYVILYSGGVATKLIMLSVPVNLDPNIQGAPPTSEGMPQPVYSASANNVLVKGGDFLDFVIAPVTDPAFNNKTVDFGAGVFELVTIESLALPEPVTCGLVGIGLILFGILNRFRPGNSRSLRRRFARPEEL
jgi:hypothetical protein